MRCQMGQHRQRDGATEKVLGWAGLEPLGPWTGPPAYLNSGFDLTAPGGSPSMPVRWGAKSRFDLEATRGPPPPPPSSLL